jgi:hypothetical protein
MEKAGYVILGAVACLWFTAVIAGMIAAFPPGLIGLVTLTGMGLLFAHVVKTRAGNADDDYYSGSIDE